MILIASLTVRYNTDTKLTIGAYLLAVAVPKKKTTIYLSALLRLHPKIF